MAPQNSTLLHEHIESTSELSRYSPILPLKEKEKGNDCYKKKSICNNTVFLIEQEDEIPIWICGEPRFISGITCKTTCNEIIQALIDDELYNNNSKPKMSSTKINSDVAVSRDWSDYVITEKWRDVEQVLTGETHILPIWEAWGHARNEVKFKLKINKSKVGHNNFDCKMVKTNRADKKSKTSGIIAKVLRRLVRQSEAIHEYITIVGEKAYQKNRHRYDFKQKFAKNQLMNDFLTDTIITTKSTNEPRSYEKILINKKSFQKTIPFMMESDDELFLLIDNNPAGSSNDSAIGPVIGCDNDSGVQMEYRQYILNQKLNSSQNAKNYTKIQQNICMIDTNNYKSNETPKRKLRSKQYYDQLRRNSLNKRLPTPHSSIFQKSFIRQQSSLININFNIHSNNNNRLELIQQSIADGLHDLNELILYEQNLVENLSKCCGKYRAQNQMYTSKLGLEMCIEEIQKNLDFYSKEIVDTEFELFKTQMEINHKRSILINLQRMLKTDHIDNKEYCRQIDDETAKISETPSEVDFVDNIYEFCDNNKSMIV